MSSATSSISSSTAVGYATQLAQISAVKRTMSNLGKAIEKGELVPASTILAAFFKANSQYVSTSPADTQSQDPLNQDFQDLAAAISDNQVAAAQSAWTQAKSDLANDGVTNLDNGAADTARLLAQNKASVNAQIISDSLGTSPGGEPTIAALLGGGGNSGSQIGLSSSLLETWLTYQPSGTTKPAAANSASGNRLDTAA